MIKIHNTTYITILIAFLAGYFELIYILLLSIIIHEFGHLFIGLLLNMKVKYIMIYPFGGITQFNEKLNVSSNKEFCSLLGGITFQILFLFLIIFLFKKEIITKHVYDLIIKTNLILISFNFLPILPLDGGRLLNILLDKIIPYKNSLNITLITSIIFTIYFLIKKPNILRILLTIFLLKNIIIEYKNINNKYTIFLLERYLYNMKFNKIKKVSTINQLYRDHNHIINNEFEINYLSKLFDRLRQIC